MRKVTNTPRTRKQAVAAARRGDIDAALETLLALHAAGDAAASAAAAEILAFQGRWKEMVPCAKALLANPDAVHAQNVIDDMKALLSRARGKQPKAPKPERPDRKNYDIAVKEAQAHKRFKGKPKDLAAHCFSLATAYNLDDEVIERWDPKHPDLLFDAACEVARALVRKRRPEPAWTAIASRLGQWYPVDAAQVLPVELLTDGILAPLLTPARAALVLRTPRAGA